MRDLTANLLSEVCNNVVTEPHLQPLSGETLQYKTANRDDNARLDIAANGLSISGRLEEDQVPCCTRLIGKGRIPQHAHSI